uniref:Uncharacterized protein n=1 Tax=Nelumbo nucifera TaxID=4432 RepID=A0A822YZ40_NELNU|nr:TPA_asm: hypothetical protein HUJ06_006646 [Nelumbo nucifera]
MSSKGRILWKAIPLAVLWSIWRERNRRIFYQKQLQVERVINLIVDDLRGRLSTNLLFKGGGLAPCVAVYFFEVS